jgi:hypothetical protein
MKLVALMKSAEEHQHQVSIEHVPIRSVEGINLND